MTSLDHSELARLLLAFQQGQLDLQQTLQQLTDPATAHTPDAAVDLDRRTRCGYPEVVYSPGKTSEAIVEIFRTLQMHQQDCLATRVSPEQASILLAAYPQARHNAVARTVCLDVGTPAPTRGKVVIVTAGTSDRPIAEEALETVRWMRSDVELIVDVGVAGPHRLPAQLHRLASADAIIVVAGMEGALPSVVGGYVACPVIGVPTSQGYGASFGGVSALLGMLNSCASNVTVVNIDSGFKAGYVAGMIARRAAAEPTAARTEPQ
ncbi:MAG: nickel pincer cofactor biosynthesis protein LarB [Planctomycetota bacterium]